MFVPLWAAEAAPSAGPWGPTEVIAALVALTVMEIVLGIDNIIFIAIVAGRLPKEQQATARTLGLGAALGTRLLLLFALTWIVGLNQTPAFHWSSLGIPAGEKGWLPRDMVSWRDLVLLGGGLFLLYKGTVEIHHKLEGEDDHQQAAVAPSFASTLAQIAVLDIVFSLDSVITAVGMAGDHLWVMVTAMVLAVGVMLVFAGPVSDFVARHPTVKMLALSFLILIGVLLVTEGFHQPIPKGYVYFAMAFSFVVEMLNLRLRKGKPVELHQKRMPPDDPMVAAAAPDK